MTTRVFKSDWFAGIVITSIFLIFSGSDFIASFERNAYDIAVKSSSRNANNKISIIAIDDRSIERIGRYPWSRDIHARMYDILSESGARVVAQTTFFSEPQLDAGLKYIRELKQSFNDSDIPAIPDFMNELSTTVESARKRLNSTKDSSNSKKIARSTVNVLSDSLKNTPLKNHLRDQIEAYHNQLNAAESDLNTDEQLAKSIQNAGNIVFNMPVIHGQAYGRPDNVLPEYVRKYRLSDKNIFNNADMSQGSSSPLPVIKMEIPIAILGEQAASIGATLPIIDVDGAVRKEAMIVDYFGDYYPSLALLLAAKSLNLKIDDIRMTVGYDVQLGRLQIKTDRNSLMNTFFYHSDNKNGKGAFDIESFSDVLQAGVDPYKYKDKIILIGATALGVGETFTTPITSAMPPVVALAHSVSSILNEDFFIVPHWAFYAQIVTIFLIALYIMFVLPKLGAVDGFVITSVLFILIMLTQFFSMTTHGIWLQLMMPALLLISGHIILTTKHFFLSEKGKAKLDIESSESNRMLGLSLQGQGQLDMAFEKFRKLALDKSVLELLYNLSLDYERKRQFNKARSVYDYISDFDDTFRDVRKRANRAKSLEENILFNSTGGLSPKNMLALDDGPGRPRLGRYEIQAELGKGAMGAVYLGKDPKISRTVAIKTMALSQEFENDELIKVKQRFFREAETAGRLTHPNIVTIFDADEEHDLAYIAMEYLKGDDLRNHIKTETLLPVKQVLSIIRRAADAIDYAHKNNVVHRDIKPANIMWDAKTDTLKITDFGIARITDASKTKTGMILGTPSYMSPEQLAGQKVTGQTDIFSLGIMLFQMVTGQLPFTGDSMTTLMFKIANQKHPNAETINPDVPRCVSIIINRAMEKDTNKRYKNGKEMVVDIEKCLNFLNVGNRES
jgi:serine/threonine-protein kinase